MHGQNLGDPNGLVFRMKIGYCQFIILFILQTKIYHTDTVVNLYYFSFYNLLDIDMKTTRRILYCAVCL